MPTYECSECGQRNIERPYDVMAVEIMCPNEDCSEFCPHVNLDNHRVRKILDRNDIEATASVIVDTFRGRL